VIIVEMETQQCLLCSDRGTGDGRMDTHTWRRFSQFCKKWLKTRGYLDRYEPN